MYRNSRHSTKKQKPKQLYLGDVLCRDTENYHDKVYKTWELRYREDNGECGSFIVAESALRDEIFNKDGKTYKDDAGMGLDDLVDVYAKATDTLESVYEKMGKKICLDFGKRDECDGVLNLI